MTRLTLFIVYLNLIGLATLQVLESWRWGTVSAVLPDQLMWAASMMLVGVAIILDRRQPSD